MKEEPFFDDATFRHVYQFSLRRKSRSLWPIFGWILAIGIISGIGIFLSIGIAVFTGFTLATNYISKKKHEFNKGRDLSNDSLVGNLFMLVFKKFDKNKRKIENSNVLVTEVIKKNEEMTNSVKKDLFEKIIKYIEISFINFRKNEDLVNIINFLIFIDNNYYENKHIWKKKIVKIFSEKFDEIYKSSFKNNNFFKNTITKSNFEQHFEEYKNLFDKYLLICTEEIIKLANKKKFNKNDGMNCLEHLIIDFNSDKIKEEDVDKIVINLLENGVINQKGIINKDLFKEIFVKDKNTTLEQKVNINIINEVKNGRIKSIKDLKNFKVSGFEIPLVNSSFIDLSNFYQINNYNVQRNLEKDFSIYIINNLKKIIINLEEIDSSIFNHFYKNLLMYINTLIKNLLQEKIFARYKTNSFENVIAAELTNEERIEFNKLVKESQNEVMNFMKDD